MARHNEVGIELTAKDLASRTIQRVGGSLTGLSDEVHKTTGRFGIFGRVASGLFNGVLLGAGIYAFSALQRGWGLLKGSIIDFNSQLEQAKIGFTQMMGSAEEADLFLKDLIQFANKTPFEVPGLITSAQMLMAFGFEAKKVLPMMENIGNAAAGLGRGEEGVARITRALGQMVAKGKVSGEEMLQLTEQGIPAWELLADKMGLTIPELRKMVEKGLIPANEAVDLLVEGMGERFPDMMKAQSRTFQGAMSTIKDSVRNVLATAFRPLFGAISDGALKMADFLSSEKFLKWSEDFAAGLQAVIDKARAFSSSVLGWVDAFRSVGESPEKLRTQLEGLLEGFSADLIEIGPNIMGFASDLKKTNPVLADVVGHAGTLVSQLGNLGFVFLKHGADSEEFATMLTHLGDTFSGLVDAALEAAHQFREKVYDAILDFANKVLPRVPEAIDGIARQIPGLMTGLLTFVLEGVTRMAESFMGFVGRAVTILHENWPQIVAAISNFFQTAFDWIINVGVPQAAAAIGPLALKFIDWVFEVLPKLLDMLDELIAAVIGFIVTNAPVLAAKLLEWAGAFVNWVVTEVIPRLIQNLPTIARTLLLFIGGLAAKLVGKALAMGAGFVRNIITHLASLPGKFSAWLNNVMYRVGQWIGSMILKAAEGGRGFVAKVVEFIKTLPSRVWEWLSSLLGKVGEFGTSLVAKGRDSAFRFLMKVVEFVRFLPQRVGQFLKEVLDGIGRWASDLWNAGIRAAQNLVNGVVEGVKSLPGKVTDAIGGAMGGVGSWIDSVIPKFDVGAWKLPRDMIAMVHKGEMIVPADVASRLRGESGDAVGSSFPDRVSSSGGGTTIGQLVVQYQPSALLSTATPTQEREAARRMADLVMNELRSRGIVTVDRGGMF